MWRKRTTKLAIGLGIYAAVSVLLHKIPYLVPSSTYETVQLAISKVLIFSVIAYMLFLSARNFLSHKHNAIVNRHRQNALMTHRALIEAAGDHGIREAIMVQAVFFHRKQLAMLGQYLEVKVSVPSLSWSCFQNQVVKILEENLQILFEEFQLLY